MSVKVDDLADAVQETLSNYVIEVSAGVATAVDETARAALAEVRDKSPKRTGRYRKGWRKKTETTGLMQLKTKAIVYNATDGPRVHLLEHGHQKAGGGRVEGVPHVKPAEDLAAELLPTLVERELGR